MLQDAALTAWDGRFDTFRLLANSLQAMIAYYDSAELGYGCRFANKAYAAAFGFTEASIVGKTFVEVIGEVAAREVQPSIDKAGRERAAVAYVRELAAADGSRRWIEVNVLPHLDAAGEPLGAFVIVTDITGHRRATQALRESEERLAKFMQASAEGIAFHRDGIVTDANPPLCELLGYSLEELRGRRAVDFVAPDMRAQVQSVLDDGRELAYESAVIRRDGLRIPVELIGRTLTLGGEQTRMSVVRDLRDRHAAQARIHHLAHHDALTGLPNRMSFMERLGHRLELARASGQSLALLFVDLDHFKRVNDSLGHLIGDKLLQTVAARISASLRSNDIVARFGGDEFIVMLEDASPDDVGEVAHKLLRAIEVPVDAEGRDLSVTPSVGIAMFPRDGATPTELIKNADTAMYIAKSRGRANCQFFDPAVASAAYDALVLESELTRALQREEFVLHFQPQVRARDGRLAGVEALIRWNHPERGLLRPDAFIALAEQQRVMLPISQWVLRSAARAALRWRSRGLIDVPIAVNLSTMQFRAKGFVDAVARVLREEGVPGEWLELELTERMLMDDVDEVKRTLQQLRALGMRVSVDDFGTGYSSLAHLKELPIDGMKIDRTFVRDLPHQRGSVAIARAVVQMAQGLSLTVVAEGVENEAQRGFLQALGCELLQGELVSAPLPATDLARWVADHRAAMAG
ncbi:MAG: putative bifunctional diguanylate cyclase/phosphodiesterase [Burkholderiaceae bacterium]